MRFLFEKSASIIYYLFILLVFFTPFIFYSHTYELFEWNKMMFVYLMTILITGFWALRMIGERKWLFEKTPLDLPLALFLVANLLSTFFSIDPHMSIFGYYSRQNGGLLSILCYSLLYYAFMANFPREKIRHLLGAIIFAGLLVSLWAILEHFGIFLSCQLLTNDLRENCWVQDVQARVFATLGQPNWLAAYLGMIIPVSLGLTLLEKKLSLKAFYLVSTITMTLAFIFTFSRGGMLGLVLGLGLFVTLLFIGKKKISLPKLGAHFKYLAIFIVAVAAFALVFGTAFNKPLKLEIGKKSPPETTQTAAPSAPSGSQLESGGTETGQIRLIVWKGAYEIWKAYPLFGSGVETFAESYYQYRPVEHNNTTEWDFLYNKAHNEYLNYLATTGSFGFVTYLLLIIGFLLYSLFKLWQSAPYYRWVIGGLLGGYIAYLVQNFFGFSVVIIALFFFLYPAIVFKLLSQGEVQALNLPFSLTKKLTNWIRNIPNPFSRAKDETRESLLFTTVFISVALLLFGLFRLYTADLKFNDGYKNEGTGGWETSKYLLNQAIILNPLEPFYQSELGYVNAVLASTAATDTEAQKDISEAEYWTTQATQKAPMSLSYWRTAARVYEQLNDNFKGFENKALEANKKAVSLAPTDPKVHYNLAALYSQLGNYPEATKEFKKVTELKTDYREAYLGLARSYEANKQRAEATAVYKDIRQRFPQETEAKVKLKEWTGSED